MLLSGEMIHEVELDTPAGVRLYLTVEHIRMEKECVSCAVKKDAGDDPDVTHGMYIGVTVNRQKEPGIRIVGGEGVGVVTRPGLAVEVGEPAINPVPRRMIQEAVLREMKRFHYQGGLCITVFAQGGREVAAGTFNPRLGIQGGISILGTSGLVEPMSEKALVDTIRLEIDQHLSEGAEILMLCPGNYGRDAAKARFGIDIDTSVKCSNYIGDALDYAVYRGAKRILLFGHAGKLSKLAAGVMNTHSRIADGRAQVFAAHAALAGATPEQVRYLLYEAATTDVMDRYLSELGLSEAVWNSIMERVMFYLQQRSGQARVEAVLFTGQGETMHMSGNAEAWLQELRG